MHRSGARLFSVEVDLGHLHELPVLDLEHSDGHSRQVSRLSELKVAGESVVRCCADGIRQRVTADDQIPFTIDLGDRGCSIG